MAIVIRHNEEEMNKINISVMDYELKWNVGETEGDKVDKLVTSFYLVNDNFPNCRAHEKALTAGEMLVIYEYVKKIVERG